MEECGFKRVEVHYLLICGLNRGYGIALSIVLIRGWCLIRRNHIVGFGDFIGFERNRLGHL